MATPTGTIDEITIGRTSHLVLEAGELARTLCGVALTAPRPEAMGPEVCYECQRRQGCDECGHGLGSTDTHLWAPGFEESNPAAAEYIYAQATCWAEHICRECSPSLYAQALTVAGVSEAEPLQLH
jgi:hypothetical protein